jgi:hypothetical protein
MHQKKSAIDKFVGAKNFRIWRTALFVIATNKPEPFIPE